MKARLKGSENWHDISHLRFAGGDILFSANDVEFDTSNNDAPKENSIDWEKVRIEAALFAMQGILANSSLVANGDFIYDGIEKAAVGYAEDLVAELQKTKRK